MAVLGAIYALGFLGVLGVSALADGGGFARLYLVGGTLTPEMVQSADFQLAMWVAMGLYLPFSMLFWYAPALVHWYGISPWKSLFFSTVASFRSFGAMTVFTLVWMGLFLAVALIVLFVVLLMGQPDLMGMIFFPVAMLMGAMFFSSIYFTFRDTFVADDAVLETT